MIKGCVLILLKEYSSVRSIINITINEEGLDRNNGFSKTYFPADNSTKTRTPIPSDIIKEVQTLSRQKDDEIRWLIALIHTICV